MAADGSVIIEIGGDPKPLENTLKKTKKESEDTASAISKAVKDADTNIKIDTDTAPLKTKMKKAVSESEEAAEAIKKALKDSDVDIEIDVDADTKPFETKMKRAKSIASGAAKAISAGFKAVGTAVTAASGALTALGVAAVKVGSGYESSVNKVASIADTTVASIAELSSRVKKMSLDTGKDASELNEALYQTISATGDTANALDLVSAAVKAAKGGFTDTVTAVDGLTTVLNAYGMSVSEADSLANKFLVTQNKGKTTFGELAGSIGNVVPTASAAGVSVDELLSAVAALTANGINTASAMTGLKAALSNIITPSDGASKAAKQMGIDFSASALKAKGLSGFMSDIQAATNGDSEAMAQLFGSVEALNSVLVLTGNGSKLFNETLDEMAVNSTALDNAYNTMSRGLEASLAKLKNSAKVFGISFYESVSEPLGDTVTLADSYINKLSKAFEDGSVTALSKSIGDVLGDAIGTVANYLPGAVSAGADVITALAEGLDKNSEKIMSAAERVFLTLTSTAKKLAPTLAGTAEKLLVSFGGFLAKNAYSITNSAVNIVTSLADGLIGAIPQLLPAAVSCIISLAGGLLDNSGKIFDCAVDILSALCDGLVNSAVIFVERAPEILLKLASALINAAATAFIDVPVAIADSIANGLIGYNWDDPANESMQSLASAYETAVDSVAEKLTRTGERINKFLSTDTSPNGEDSSLYIDKTKSELENIAVETSEAIDKYEAAMKELSSEEVSFDPTKLSQETYKALAKEFGADRMAEIDLILDKNIKNLKDKRNAVLAAWQELFEAEGNKTTSLPESSAIADYYNKNGKANEEALQSFLDGEKTAEKEISSAGQDFSSTVNSTGEEVVDELDAFYDDLQYRLARGWIDEDKFKAELKTKLESSSKYACAQYTRYWAAVADSDKQAAEEVSQAHGELESIVAEAESLGKSLNTADTFSVTSETNKRSGDVNKKYGITDYGKKVEARRELLGRVKSLAAKGVPAQMLRELIGLDPEEALVFADQLDRLSTDDINGLTSDYEDYKDVNNELAVAVTAAGYDDYVEAGKSYAEALADGIAENQDVIREALFEALPDLRELAAEAVNTRQSNVAASVSTSASYGSTQTAAAAKHYSGGSSGTLSATIPITVTLVADGKELAKVVTKQQQNIEIEGGK